MAREAESCGDYPNGRDDNDSQNLLDSAQDRVLFLWLDLRWFLHDVRLQCVAFGRPDKGLSSPTAGERRTGERAPFGYNLPYYKILRWM